MSHPINARNCRGLTADIGDGCVAPVASLIVASMALMYGAPADVGPATPWHEVGTDFCRIAFLDHVEEQFAINLTDDQREHIHTVGDLIDVIEREQRAQECRRAKHFAAAKTMEHPHAL